MTSSSLDNADYTYLQIHFYFTLPTLCVLFFLVRPILHPLPLLKLSLLSFLAFFYTTPWDNYILAQNAWYYCSKCVSFTIGYVPIEEYLFFIIQTWLSGLIATCIFHFSSCPMHLLLLNNPKSAPKMHQARSRGALFFLALGLLHWCLCKPGSPYFYFSCIMWWSMPVLALQWYVAGHFILAQATKVIVAIALPTIYLSLVDAFALQHGVWTISPDSIMGIYLLKNFPFEEFFFFFITNVMLVFGMVACDRTFAIMKLRSLLSIFSPYSKASVTSKLQQAFECTLFQETNLNQLVLEDMFKATRSIEKGSRSFYFASLLFPWEVRQDIHTMYYFCRVTDDIADEEPESKEQREMKLNGILSVLQSAYQYQKKYKKNEFNVRDHEFIKLNLLTKDQVSAVRGMCRLISIVPFKCIKDLFKGYFWDLNRTLIRETADVIQYSKYVASTVGEMMTYLMLSSYHVHSPHHDVLVQASDFSIAMQLMNIARDIITDSKLHRMYLPLDLVPQSQANEFSALQNRLLNNNVHASDLSLIKSASLRLISLAKVYQLNGEKGLPFLPRPYRMPVKLASRIYSEIGRVIQSSDIYPERAIVSKPMFFWILFYLCYIDDICSLLPSVLLKQKKAEE